MKQKISGIYKITNPSGRIYIGKSVNVVIRFQEHRSDPIKRKQRKKYVEPILNNSMIKYGPTNHFYEIIKECPVPELNFWEKHFILLFDTYNTKHGMNCTSGGDGGMAGVKLSEEHKKRIGDAQRGEKNHRWGKKMTPDQAEKHRVSLLGNKSTLGQKQSAETIAKRILKTKGLKRTSETIKRMSEANKGQIVTEEMKMKISEALKGVKHTFGRIQKKQKLILNMQYGIFYYGLKDASESIGISPLSLGRKLRGMFVNNTPLVYA